MEQKFCSYCMSPVGDDGACAVCGLTAGTYTPSPHHLPPGTVLADRYLVGRVLGEGGFGITYIGCDLRLELKVAIKEYFPTDQVTRISAAGLTVSQYSTYAAENFENGKRRFLYEARTMARMIKQPEIVTVRDFFEANSTAYIVMEYVEGTTFKELVQQKGGRIAPRELLTLIEPLFGALTAVHAQGLIHRDISPENLMIEHGAVRLLDFGCARESANGTDTLTITLKHGYAPIEQYQRRGQGPWTDVYALCATLYYCLTGTRPPQAVDRLVEDELIPPSKLGIALTPGEEAALLQGMVPQPRRRYQTVEQLRAALYADFEAECRENPVEQPEQKEKKPKKEPKKKPKKKFLFIKILAVLLAVPVVLMILYVIVVFIIGVVTAITDNDPPPDPSDDTVQSDTMPPDTSDVSDSADESDDVVLDMRPFTPLGENVAVVKSADTFVSAAENPMHPAIVVENGANVVILQDIELTKPVYVEGGATLRFDANVTVRDTLLQVSGTFENAGLLTLTADAQLTMSNISTLVNDGTIWFEAGADNLYAPYGLSRVGTYIAGAEEDIFADAARVSTMSELMERSGDPNVSAVIIENDLEISVEYGLPKPVRIEEGVTVTISDSTAMYIDSAPVFNHGTIQGSCIVLKLLRDTLRPALINYGTIDTKNITSYAVEAPVINYGVIAPRDWIDLSSMAHNFGEIAAPHEHSAYVQKHGTLYNDGTIHAGMCFNVETTAHFSNRGECIVAGTSAFESFGTVTNHGLIRVEDEAAYLNRGVMHNYGSIYVAENGPWIENTGLFAANETSEHVFSGREIGGIQIYLADLYERAMRVDNEDELNYAIGADSVSMIYVTGAVNYNGSLIAGKDLWIMPGASLHVTGNLIYSNRALINEGTLSVDGNIDLRECSGLANLGTLSCNMLGVNAATAFVQYGTIESINALQTQETSLFTVGTQTIFNGTAIDLQSDNIFVFADIFLRDGAEMIVGETCYFWQRGAKLVVDQHTHFVNHGFMDMGGSHNYGGDSVVFFICAGTAENHGEMICNEARFQLSSRFENCNILRLRNGARIVYIGDGEFIGNAAERE